MKYLDQYKLIHENKKYGITGSGHVDELRRFIPENADSLLDYGAGQSTTAHLLKMQTGIEDVVAYDPAVIGRDEKPSRNFDCVICTDVMEHVPEEEIREVLGDIWGYAELRAIFIIAHGPAGQILPNGENAHVTQQPPEWWKKQLEAYWPNVTHFALPNDYWSLYSCDRLPS